MPEILDNSSADLILPTLLRYSTIAFAFASPIPLNDCKVFSSALLMFTLEEAFTLVAAFSAFCAAVALVAVTFSAACALVAATFYVA